MAINGVSPPVTTSEIEPAAAQSRPAGPGATPALQSSSGLIGRRGGLPDATRRQATVPAMAAAQAVVPLNQGASTSTSMPPLSHLFQMEDEQARWTLDVRVARRFDDDIGKGIVARAMEGLVATDTPPSSPGPGASRWMWEPAVGEASGSSGQTAAPGPRPTRGILRGARAGSPVHAIAAQSQVAQSRGPHTAAAPWQQPGQSSSPGGGSPSNPAARKISFSEAEQRMFDPDDGDPKALGEPVEVPFPSDAAVAARGKSAARSSSEEAQANTAVNKAEEEARLKYAHQLGDAVGRLQGLAVESPERVQQAIQRGILPAEVLGDRLDPRFVQDVLDLHAQFDQNGFGDPGGIAEVMVEARKAFTKRAKSQADLQALKAEVGETSGPPVLEALNADQLLMVTAALNGGGQAVRRLSERAERAEPAKAAPGRLRQALAKPKPLEGTRRRDFVALVDRDIEALVTKLRIEPSHAADLLQRAVHAGHLGTHALRPQDRALLLEVLAAKALNGGG